jgi:alpha-1,6-mannosyltransferase
METETPERRRANARLPFERLRSVAVPVWLLMIGGAMLWLCWWARDLHRFTQWVAAYVWLFVGELAMCGLACGVVLKGNRHSSRAARWLTLGIILAVAIALRVVLVPQRPYLSTDAYRYAWDGHVQAQGVNPYRFAPAAPELERLRDQDHYPNVSRIYPNINRAGLPTPYPPGAQLLYRLINWLQPLSVTAFKAAALAFDLITTLALMLTLKRARLDPARAILFAWHPLPIWEGSHTGHIEAAFMMLLALALLAWTGRRHWLTGVLLGLAAAVKYYPALVLPAFLRAGEGADGESTAGKSVDGESAAGRSPAGRSNEPAAAPNEPVAAPPTARLKAALRAVVSRANLVMLGGFAAALVAVYLPYVWTGATGFGSLGNEFTEEGFNGTGARYFALGLIHKIAPLPATVFLVTAGAVLAGLALWWAARAKPGVAAVAHGAATLIGAYWLLTSPRYAWYYAWILPFLCFAPRLGWFYLTGASVFMYFLWYEPLVYPDLPLWLGAIVYLPALAWLAWEKWRAAAAADEGRQRAAG